MDLEPTCFPFEAASTGIGFSTDPALVVGSTT
jgi:hypothetical protein